MDREDLQTAVLKAKDLAGVSESQGGQIIRKALAADIISIVRILGNTSKTMPETELRSWAISLGEKLSMLELLNGAPGDYEKAAQDLKEALNESS